MQELIDTVLTLLPVALLIALRILMSAKNRETSLQKGRSPKSRFFASLEEFRETSAQEKKTSGGGTYGPSPAERNKKAPLSRRSVLPKGRPYQVSPPEEELRVFPQGIPAAASAEKEPAVPSRKREMNPLLQPLPEERGMQMAVVERIERLPLLQRAVVWSEILGPPKSLD
ncbi:MAG: hypothetical protein N2509_06170 [Treponemataceae bacterium]|nr:hypothetical protein [Treponemataceae bacterium]HOJ99386.1 hypothetical protein [Termitinemataceae bacterium]HOM23044.1 hypothetical protein [Termitinemataceae bacterium]HPQ00417.1 hypothetical protein [Termitinemataceae bacterium]